MSSRTRFRVAPARLVGTSRHGPARALGAALDVGGGSGWRANDPGWATFAEINLNMAVPSGSPTERLIPGGGNWHIIFDDLGAPAGGGPGLGVSHSPTSNFSLITDATEPASPSGAWNLWQAAGIYTDGHGHGNIGIPVTSTNRMYGCYSCRWNTGYNWHAISNKHINLEVSGGSPWLIQSFIGTGGGMWMRAEDLNLGIGYNPQINTALTLGVWHILEFQVEAGTPGVVKVWVDGELRTNYTNLNVQGPFISFGIYGHRGGGGETNPSDCSYDLGHIYIAT